MSDRMMLFLPYRSDDSPASSPLLGGRENSPALLCPKDHTGKRVIPAAWTLPEGQHDAVNKYKKFTTLMRC